MSDKKETQPWLTIRDIQRHLAERKQYLIAQYERDGEEVPFDVLYGDGRQPKGYPPPEEWLQKRYEHVALHGRVTARVANLSISYPPPNARSADLIGAPEPDEAAQIPPVPYPEIPEDVVAQKKHGRKLAMPDPKKLDAKQRWDYVVALTREENALLNEADEYAERGDYERAKVSTWLAEEARADVLRMQSVDNIWIALARVAAESDPAISIVEEHVQKLDTALEGAVRTLHQVMNHNQLPQYGPYPGLPSSPGPVVQPPDYGRDGNTAWRAGTIPPPAPRR